MLLSLLCGYYLLLSAIGHNTRVTPFQGVRAGVLLVLQIVWGGLFARASISTRDTKRTQSRVPLASSRQALEWLWTIWRCSMACFCTVDVLAAIIVLVHQGVASKSDAEPAAEPEVEPAAEPEVEPAPEVEAPEAEAEPASGPVAAPPLPEPEPEWSAQPEPALRLGSPGHDVYAPRLTLTLVSASVHLSSHSARTHRCTCVCALFSLVA